MKTDFWSFLSKWIPSEKDPIQDGYELLEIQSADQKYSSRNNNIFQISIFSTNNTSYHMRRFWTVGHER